MLRTHVVKYHDVDLAGNGESLNAHIKSSSRCYNEVPIYVYLMIEIVY